MRLASSAIHHRTAGIIISLVRAVEDAGFQPARACAQPAIQLRTGLFVTVPLRPSECESGSIDHRRTRRTMTIETKVETTTPRRLLLAKASDSASLGAAGTHRHPLRVGNDVAAHLAFAAVCCCTSEGMRPGNAARQLETLFDTASPRYVVAAPRSLVGCGRFEVDDGVEPSQRREGYPADRCEQTNAAEGKPRPLPSSSPASPPAAAPTTIAP